LHGLYPAHPLPVGIANLGAALVGAGWLSVRHLRSDPLSVIFLSAVPTLLAAAFLALPVPYLGAALVLMVAYGLAALVYAGKIPQAAVPVFAIYLPILLNNFQPEQGQRIVIELLTLVPMGALFIRRRFRMATSAILISAVITGGFENSGNGGMTSLIILLLFLVALAIGYEVRIPRADYSPLRSVLDQGLLVVLAYMALYAFDFKSTDRLNWTWAIAVALYQGLQCWREKLAYPTRIGVAAMALTLALWTTDGLPSAIPLAGGLLMAGLTNVAALLVGSSLLSTIGLLLLIPGAVNLYELGTESASATVVILGLLTSVGVALIAARPTFAAPGPWWKGFLREKDVEWTRSFVLMAFGTVLKFPLAAFVFNIFRSCFMWLRYFKGEENRFGLNDLLYAAAHAYGALILSRQAQLATAASAGSVNVQLTVATSVWLLWGLVVFCLGAFHRSIYQRFVGLTLMLVPEALYYPAIKGGDAPLALVCMLAGGAFLIVGIVREIRGRGAPGDEREDELGEAVVAVAGSEVAAHPLPESGTS